MARKKADAPADLHLTDSEPEQAGKPAMPAAKPRATKPLGSVYQLIVTLMDVKPPVWRRLLVPDCSLSTLHEIIQAAMGWENYHMYEFKVGDQRYTDSEFMHDLGSEDAGRMKFGRIATGEKAKFRYTYDFGDDWRHEVLVEKISSREKGKTYPVCIAGKRACPPEDCGGAWGYMEFSEAIKNPEHERHAEFLEWRGEFDPEAFDPDAVNL